MYHSGYNSSGKPPQFSSIVVITWSPSDGAQIKFGEIGGGSAANPHSMALMQFTNSLNQTKSLSDTLLQVVRSFKLCRALGRLPITCSVGTVQDPTIQMPRNYFSGIVFEIFTKKISHGPGTIIIHRKQCLLSLSFPRESDKFLLHLFFCVSHRNPSEIIFCKSLYFSRIISKILNQFVKIFRSFASRPVITVWYFVVITWSICWSPRAIWYTSVMGLILNFQIQPSWKDGDQFQGYSHFCEWELKWIRPIRLETPLFNWIIRWRRHFRKAISGPEVKVRVEYIRNKYFLNFYWNVFFLNIFLNFYWNVFFYIFWTFFFQFFVWTSIWTFFWTLFGTFFKLSS